MYDSRGHQLLIGGDQKTTLTTACKLKLPFLVQFSPPVDELVGLSAVASKESEAAKSFSAPL